MNVYIDFTKREIHFEPYTTVDEMASTLNNYFPEVVWGDFKIMIDAATKKERDIGYEPDLPF